jgi:hypothetical protein
VRSQAGAWEREKNPRALCGLSAPFAASFYTELRQFYVELTLKEVIYFENCKALDDLCFTNLVHCAFGISDTCRGGRKAEYRSLF